MKILITGGTGMVGQPLVSVLEKNNWEINLLSRRPAKFPGRKIKVFVTDWTKKLPATIFQDLEGVINLMGESIIGKRWTTKQKDLIYKSRVDNTKFLIQQINLHAAHMKFYIQASAIGYYGTSEKKTFQESDPSGEDFLAHLCQDWEAQTEKLTCADRVAIFRLGVVLSRQGGLLKKVLLPFKMGLGSILGSGRQKMSWIHIQDLVQMIIEATIRPQYRGVYNAVAPEIISNREFSQLICQKLSRPLIFRTPALLIKLLAGEVSALLLESSSVRSENLTKAGYQFTFPALEKALNNLLLSSGEG
jgi:uncharacterized protein